MENFLGKWKAVKRDNHRKYTNSYNTAGRRGNFSSREILKLYTLYLINYNQDEYGISTYSYEIITDIITKLQDETVWKPSHGTLYPLIHKMEQEKLIILDKSDRPNIKKKYYFITQKGKKELDRMIKEYKVNIKGSLQLYNILSEITSYDVFGSLTGEIG
jgi:DNA-binding PadR family transcriptional regulator